MSHSNTSALPSTRRKWKLSGAVSSLVPNRKNSCTQTLELNGVGVLELKEKLLRLPGTRDHVIFVINTADILNYAIADNLFALDWDLLFDKKQKPFARGTSPRKNMAHLLDKVDPVAGLKLREMSSTTPVLVIDFGVVEVFPITLLERGVMIIDCGCPGWVSGEGLTFDTQDAREQEWTKCPFCEKPFRIQVK
ncbi:MAG: hypothetical protein V4697_01885 [Patescibacteria group bacterium]